AETCSLDGRDMDEYVLAASVRLNKTITLRRVEPLHCTCRHVHLPIDSILRAPILVSGIRRRKGPRLRRRILFAAPGGDVSSPGCRTRPPSGRSRLRSRQESSTVVCSGSEWTPKVQTASAYLQTLNPEQRRAVEHGAAGGSAASPLLVIAGAGSGKTNTLAHRVAHLIVQGADPRRILLMTFSRRAAFEMTRRVERIARKVMADNAGVMTDALTWAGTYHGIGARLLREYAEQIGLDPAFTIHDREDSADLMNLVRHEAGFSKTES